MKKPLIKRILGFLLNTLILITSVMLCELTGYFGSFFVRGSIYSWYADLAKPVLTPPAEVFGPVWAILYFLMGVALFLVVTKWKFRRAHALVIFFIQLALNAAWPVIFFGQRSLYGGMVVLIALLPTVLVTIMRFRRVSSLAGTLLFPYLAWISFAAYLNAALLSLNP